MSDLCFSARVPALLAAALLLAAGWFAVSRFGAVALLPLVVLLAGQLVWFARLAGRPTPQSPR